jgi:hypothetical protein
MDIQKRIDRIVKHLPDGQIEFMGYIWPAELIGPVHDFNKLRHPTIKQCIEYIVGIDLWFFPFPPPKRVYQYDDILLKLTIRAAGAHGDQKFYDDFVHNGYEIPHRKHAEDIPTISNCKLTQDMMDFCTVTFQIYEDITKDVHIGSLPAGKDETIPRQAFLEWLNEYMPGDGNSENQRQKNDPMGDLVEYLLATDQGKMKTNDVIQLLESKNIRFDFPNMPKEEKKNMVNELRGIGLSKRIVALILDWQRIKSKQVKLNSTMRRL